MSSQKTKIIGNDQPIWKSITWPRRERHARLSQFIVILCADGRSKSIRALFPLFATYSDDILRFHILIMLGGNDLLYADGTEIKMGQKLLTKNGAFGVVVCCIGSNEFSEGYPKKHWDYLKDGVLVEYTDGVLIHYSGVTDYERISITDERNRYLRAPK